MAISTDKKKPSLSIQTEKNVKEFRRKLHTAQKLRVGLHNARAKIDATYYADVVNILGQNPLYKPIFAQSAFPKNYSEFRKVLRIKRLDAEKEFLWSAAVISQYSEKLKLFNTKRGEFEKYYLCGEFEQANETLDYIENNLGVSLWLIENRIQILQLRYGIKEQKSYLEKVINSEGLSSYAAYICLYASVRSEDNVTLNVLETELKELLYDGEVRDFVLYQMVGFDYSRIKDPSIPIAWSEGFPIIDRYQVHVAMSQLHAATRGIRSDSYVYQSLKLIESIDDIRVKRMIALTSYDLSLEETLSKFDAYTIGEYSRLNDHEPGTLELAARNRIFTHNSGDPRSSSAIDEKIIEAMSNVLRVAPSYNKDKEYLEKAALTCAHHSVSIEIAAFLNRQHEHVFVKEYSELDLISAISGPLDNPWSAVPLAAIIGDSKFLENLNSTYPDSPSLRLHNVFRLSFEDGLQELEILDLPEHRKAIYKGHLAYQHKKNHDAISYYKLAIAHQNDFVSNRAKIYLFNALFAEKLIGDCILLAAEHYLENPNVSALYPFEELAKKALSKRSEVDLLSLSIVLNIAAKQSNPKLERDLSDIYEAFMHSIGIDRPHQLDKFIDQFGLERITYFLKHICTPRILEDNTSFESVSDIETERIATCQLLIEIDEINKDSYATEIRAITRDLNIAQLLEKVLAGKIYVDEEGIKAIFQSTLPSMFARYVELLNLPAIDYHAEKISKRIEKILNEDSSGEIKNLKLPASEREGMFATMLHDFVSQFATNPAYGLDTHLSTTIRHGAFEGHIRSPLAVQDLLCNYDKKNQRHELPEKWKEHFSDLDSESFEYIRKQLSRFTIKVEELIEHYRSKLLQVQGTGVDVEGMFNFHVAHADRIALMETVTSNTSYEEFLDRLFGFSWALAKASMEKIKAQLKTHLRVQIINALNALIASVENKISQSRALELRDAIIKASTDLNTAIDDICDWFRQPNDLNRDPFEFESALGVALKQIENCYIKIPLHLEQTINVAHKIEGMHLDGLVEILFILIQNIIRHSGFSKTPTGLHIKATQETSHLLIEVENELANSIDITCRRNIASEAVRLYKRDSALKMARKEGGSGLSKVWRICEYDLKKSHSITILVTENRRFIVQLIINDLFETNENIFS